MCRRVPFGVLQHLLAKSLSLECWIGCQHSNINAGFFSKQMDACNDFLFCA